jgi:2-polyprenyl-3-methyl-5-hydroxy-6-metoxy-1,4-benzoquinol methylase
LQASVFREDYTLPEVWDVLQRIQTDFSFNQELASYYTNPRWLEARSVLDIGTGNGHYLCRLASNFPDKAYVGVDVESTSIEVARQRAGSEQVHFTTGNVYDLRGHYDFIIMRLLMQHLDRPRDALDKVAQLLNPGGCALIIDALDRVRYFHPEPRRYMEFFRCYKRHQLARGMDRDVAQKVGRLLRGHPRLRRAASTELVVPSTIPGNLELFEQTYYLVVVMVELTGGLRHDFAAVKTAWRDWCALPNRFMQVGLRLVTVHAESP